MLLIRSDAWGDASGHSLLLRTRTKAGEVEVVVFLGEKILKPIHNFVFMLKN